MEEDQTEEQLAVLDPRLAPRELRVVHVVVEPDHVCLEALGRLRHHLDARLQDGDGELGVRVGREPEPEIAVGLALREALHDLLQGVHPGDHEVAVGQQDPVPLLHARGQEGVCHGRLPLAQREALEPVLPPLRVGERLQRVERVHAGRQDEDERQLWGGFCEDACTRKGRMLTESG